ncbi:hypothetical protein CEUSTIGMA_g2013.t1 [Chlamydomonas eustigma]|uniref:Phospholipase B-like n=1 Tax=Chlamydomonas eustigma TaxID=1157962 RepID=A0A250WUQ7_9CHLO|nr:hypothetical protein CEUSTIGMA_g2013.t1 [Chlamydomonas eustigma]|eukprot:GAX74564.1 hypothetical protein CEUSTIGMA_g2013.t1 [Chlamydomonas eustigma]
MYLNNLPKMFNNSTVLLLAVSILFGSTVSSIRGTPNLQVLRDEISQEPVFGSVLKEDEGMRFSSEATADNSLAWGSYIDSLKTASNFGKLRIVTSKNYSDSEQMRAAGFLEGWLSAERIYDQYINIYSYFTVNLYPGEDLAPAMKWLDDQELWVRRLVQSKSKTDPMMRSVGLVLEQFEGLVQGYQARSQVEATLRRTEPSADSRDDKEGVSVGWLERKDLVFLNNNGDLYDIIEHLQNKKIYREFTAGEGLLNPPSRISPRMHTGDIATDAVNATSTFNKVALQGRCSAIIKVAGDLSDVFVGHSTWDSYTNALRIYKHYEFNLNDPAVSQRKLSFSSYPGELLSDDDLYISDTGLVVVETTNHVFEASLLDCLSPYTLPSWHRVRAAFMIATSGQEWVKLFSNYNSGTYNNQYMVVDMNKFEPRKQLNSGFLWVVEQIPNQILATDATEMVALGYWPSYNIPYFEAVYNATGYRQVVQEMEEKDPVKYKHAIRWLKYQACPRAQIFRRDQASVSSVEDMKNLMRYNDWRHDKFSDSNPVNAICGRGDLEKGNHALPIGCFDSKVTSFRLARNMESEVVNGPTLTADFVPFAWEGKWADPVYVHRGHPTQYNFAFERMSPKEFPLPGDESVHEVEVLKQGFFSATAA